MYFFKVQTSVLLGGIWLYLGRTMILLRTARFFLKLEFPDFS